MTPKGEEIEEEEPGWIGGGDFRIAVIMGLALGPIAGLLAVLLGYLFGAVASLPLVALTAKSGKSMIPLGPFLALGTVIALLWGDPIVTWYLGLIGF
jgi:Type II secretory pathway, prepilin signal peptidase PulO and related peptidases